MTKPVDWQAIDVAGLFRRALPRKSNYWTVVFQLRSRPDPAVFATAEALCQSLDERERELGADVLAQWNVGDPSWDDRICRKLVAMLYDPSPAVQAAAAFGVGHRRTELALPRLLELAHHPQWRVRHGAAFGLMDFSTPEAITALIVLSSDRAFEVRNWATFGLSDMTDVDSEAIQQALIARLNDRTEISVDALNGLARRKHPKALAWTLSALESGEEAAGHFEAATHIASPALLPALEKLQLSCTDDDDSYYRNRLRDAINACGGVSSQ